MANTVIKRNLTSAGKPVTLSNTRVIRFMNYATDHTKAEVTTAGYFNASAADLTVNSIINVVYDCDGTPGYARVRIAAMPSGGDITVTDWTNPA